MASWMPPVLAKSGSGRDANSGYATDAFTEREREVLGKRTDPEHTFFGEPRLPILRDQPDPHHARRWRVNAGGFTAKPARR